MITAIRKQLKAAALKAPQEAQGYIGTLDMQLGRFARANEADKAALRPVMEQTITMIKRLMPAGRTGDKNG